MLRPNLNKSRTQHFDLVDQQPIPVVFGQVNGEKKWLRGYGSSGIRSCCRFVTSDVVRASPHPTALQLKLSQGDSLAPRGSKVGYRSWAP
jgi:hypothetical protein